MPTIIEEKLPIFILIHSPELWALPTSFVQEADIAMNTALSNTNKDLNTFDMIPIARKRDNCTRH